ncbi:MAG: histidine phosphatase family protein [Pseudomonadota bacterium]
MKLLFLRHGESEYNLKGLCNADPAVPVGLTPTGRRQAEAAADRLRSLPIRRVYVSRLLRARETAQIVNARHGAEIRVDARLDDRNSGFEGLPVARYLDTMGSAPDPFSWKAPGGESYLEMVARVQAFLAEVRQLDLPAILVVTHHEVLQAVAGCMGGLDPAHMWRIPVDHCQVLRFDGPGG